MKSHAKTHASADNKGTQGRSGASTQYVPDVMVRRAMIWSVAVFVLFFVLLCGLTARFNLPPFLVFLAMVPMYIIQLITSGRLKHVLERAQSCGYRVCPYCAQTLEDEDSCLVCRQCQHCWSTEECISIWHSYQNRIRLSPEIVQRVRKRAITIGMLILMIVFAIELYGLHISSMQYIVGGIVLELAAIGGVSIYYIVHRRMIMATVGMFEKLACPGCLYDLRNCDDTQPCPECGHPWQRDEVIELWTGCFWPKKQT